MIEPEEIIRSNRKTVALIVDRKGKFIVRAPYNTGNAVIMKFIEKKQDWLKAKLTEIETAGGNIGSILVANNEVISVLGNDFIIKITGTQYVTSAENIIFIPEKGDPKTLLKEWLKNQAMIILTNRAEQYSKIMGVKYGKLRISEAKTIWGSCSHINNLNFSWRLIMCPVELIDYVVVHELSHISFKNHSKEFWERVKSVLPDFKERQSRLKSNHNLMEII